MKFFKLIADSWIDSIKLLLPKNFQFLILLSIKALFDLVKNKSFLLLVTIGISILVLFLNSLFIFKMFLWFLISIYYIIIFACALRPSINLKNLNYFITKQYLPKIFFLSFFIFLYLIFVYFNIFEKLSNFGFISIIFLPIIIFYLLFLLDSEQYFIDYFKSFGRAFIMFFYNLPFFLTFFIIFYLILTLILKIFIFLFPFLTNQPLIWYIINILFIMPLYMSILTSFYIKRVHDQFLIYFKQINIQ